MSSLSNVRFFTAIGCCLLLNLSVACDDSGDDSDAGQPPGTGGFAAAPAGGTGGAAPTGGAAGVAPTGGAAGAAPTGGAAGAAGVAGMAGAAGAAGTPVALDGGPADGNTGTEDGGGADGGEPPSEEPLDYSDAAMWLCKPGAADNPCEVDVSATEVLADNTLGTPITHEVNTAADFDCFFVYPTENMSYTAGNHHDLTDNAAIKAKATAQAARFSSLCRVYAPYYRQMTIGSYMSPDYQQYFDFAYRDVIDAFNYYMENENNGRDFVLLGHSQGSHMLTKVIQEEIDDVPEMRDKLISALLIGSSEVFVPDDALFGGSFQNIPLCSSDTETGCVVTYNCIAEPDTALLAGTALPPEGQKVACVHPGALGGGEAYLNTYVSTATSATPDDVTTPYAIYRDFYTGECVGEGAGHGLVVQMNPSDPADQRTAPLDFASIIEIMTGSTTSLHPVDFEMAMGDLVDLVASQAAAR